MELQSYTEVNGALRTKKFREVPNSGISKKEGDKQEALDTATVTISTGKVFYADAISRIDLISACQEALENSLQDDYESDWKLAEPIDGKQIVLTTVAEIREARSLALRFKGGEVGVS